ncbi:hypothetical protein C7S18_21060 [Ahniella affigens]|uniref:Calcineurin-like phosphoesterase domain-containing protein n=1 Tax=Ahniella affigens TaxID=2021234 RepID=A0A2P1PXD1_9GAMM|nr:hypothetical protein [Ahniella affigens]AVP99508.1 hypothetical protein C7S18_21060 [Ahniella affigens]
MVARDSFDVVYVVSDLHIGGAAGFQIFSGSQSFPAFIDQVRLDAALSAALVINGDFIDFLAEPNARYFDAHGALDKLHRIMADASFKASFDAMAALVQTPERFLLINLGNHDLELCLDAVQAALVHRLAGADPAAQSRIRFIADGTGLSLRVGYRRVLCVHGNEVDDWNVVDFEVLRRIRQGINVGVFERGADPTRWVPNAGTQLVIDAMNTIKARHPFVDVLKPEKEGAVKLLAAVDRSVLKHLGSMAAAYARKVGTSFGLLSGDSGEGSQEGGAIEPRALRLAEQKRLSAELLDRAELRLAEGVSAYDLTEQSGTLGFWSAIGAKLTGQGEERVLQEALESLDQDQSFRFDVADADNERAQDRFAQHTDFLVSGHTHFDRSLIIPTGHHFNTGTWAYLMRLDPALRKDLPAFKSWLEDTKSGSLADLVKKKRLLIRQSYARLAKEPDGRCHGALWRFGEDKPVSTRIL